MLRLLLGFSVFSQLDPNGNLSHWHVGVILFLGLGFIIRIIVFAIIIELADKLSKDFKTIGFLTSLWLAIILAIVGAIVDAILF